MERIFHLSYDVRDSYETDNDDIRKRITEALCESGITEIEQPVQTTLLIYADGGKYEDIKAAIKSFSCEIHYVLSQVAHLQGESSIAVRKDAVLNGNYQEILQKIQGASLEDLW